MTRKTIAVLAAAAAAAVFGTGFQVALADADARPGTSAASQRSPHGKYEPVLNPRDFVRVINNPYFPLPAGRTLVYRGVKDGRTQVDRVHVTRHTKVLEGIKATAVSDVSTHEGKLLEKTTDWYAQDKQGTVWYLGEKTAAYLPNGKIDRSGSWQAGVKDAEPGIVMLAHPEVPDAYRQEYQKGNAEDTAWIVIRGGSVRTPLGTLRRTITSLEFTRLEPGVIDQKIYAPGIGIVVERAVRGPAEVARLVSVNG